MPDNDISSEQPMPTDSAQTPVSESPPVATSLPAFTAPKPKAPALKGDQRRWLIGAIIALSLILIVQIMLANRQQLAADASWRPRIAALCSLFGCNLPAWRETTAFSVLSREIRPHPTATDALLVTASFRNEAAYPQPWPVIELALTDLDGGRIGLRRFNADEYLGRAPASDHIGPGQSASIALEIVDPGNRAVAFEFTFF